MNNGAKDNTPPIVSGLKDSDYDAWDAAVVMARPRILVPSFCKEHLHDFIVKRLEMAMGTTDTEWQRWMITGQLLLLTLVVKSERTQKLLRTGRDLQEILTTQGCLACGHYRAYCFVVQFLKSKGLQHGNKVAVGEIEDSKFTEWR